MSHALQPYLSMANPIQPREQIYKIMSQTGVQQGELSERIHCVQLTNPDAVPLYWLPTMSLLAEPTIRVKTPNMVNENTADTFV